MSTEFKSHEEADVRVRKAREDYQAFHGEAPPVNPGEASNGVVRLEFDYEEAGDYEGVKKPNPAYSKTNCISDSPHVHEPGDDWQKYDPSESFATDEEVSHAADVFERMTGEEENPLDPKLVSDGGRGSMSTVDHEGPQGVSTQDVYERG